MTSGFDILPAIDLRGGRVVRLEQGDFGRETAFSDDPVAVARSFVEAGARWLHVVDLDGARTGEPAHTAIIRDIVQAVGRDVAVEVAGGLRTEESVATVLTGGAARVVVGTVALRDPAFAGRLVASHGADRIAVALDVRDGMALGEGWRLGAPGIRAEDALVVLSGEGARTFEATAIDHDGRLNGPDLDLLGRLVALDRGRIIASGGVATIDDVRATLQIGCAGAIVGRALYEGRLDLRLAVAAAAPEAAHMGRRYAGVVLQGYGVGSQLMSDPSLVPGLTHHFPDWQPVPGTLNVRLPDPFDPALLPLTITSAELGGVTEDHRYAPVVIEGAIPGLVIQTLNPGGDFPAEVVELIADRHLRTSLSLADGDRIAFELV